MKKLLIASSIILASLGLVSAQGTVKFYDVTSAYFVSTNGTGTAAGQNGTTTGLISSSPADSYYFALFWSTAVPTSSNPLTGGWTLATSDGTTPLVGNNFVAGAGTVSGNGGNGGTAINGIALGGQAYFEMVGWSASLGTSVTQVLSQYESGLWAAAGYFGISPTSGLITTGGAGTPASLATALFSSTGISGPTMLNGVSAVPEPGTMALAGLGSLSLLLFRRKK